jgi:hypothetical protein
MKSLSLLELSGLFNQSNVYSHRIVGWAIDKHMTTSLISRAMIKAYNIRHRQKVWCFTVTEDRSTPVKPFRNY